MSIGRTASSDPRPALIPPESAACSGWSRKTRPYRGLPSQADETRVKGAAPSHRSGSSRGSLRAASFSRDGDTAENVSDCHGGSPAGEESQCLSPQPPSGAASIDDRPYDGPVYEDAKDPAAKFPPIQPLRPPAGAPNVLVVLLDDVGFGGLERLRGPRHTPTAERLAADRPQVQPLPHDRALPADAPRSSPAGIITPSAWAGSRRSRPLRRGTAVPPNKSAPLAETLKLNGYATAQFGKCHEVPVWETSPRPVRHLAERRRRFEYFYGFIGGETNQYYPAMYEGTTPVEPDKTPRRATTSPRT